MAFTNGIEFLPYLGRARLLLSLLPWDVPAFDHFPELSLCGGEGHRKLSHKTGFICF